MKIGEPKYREIFNALAEVPENWNFHFYFQQANTLCLVNDNRTIEIYIRNFIIRYPNEIFSLHEPINEGPIWN